MTQLPLEASLQVMEKNNSLSKGGSDSSSSEAEFHIMNNADISYRTLS